MELPHAVEASLLAFGITSDGLASIARLEDSSEWGPRSTQSLEQANLRYQSRRYRTDITQDQLRRAPGGLMAYAVDLAELLRRMAHDVH